MAENLDEKIRTDSAGRRGHDGDASPDAALAGASRAEADAYLRKQREFLDLQIEDLRREDRLRHWSLRVHHLSDVLKLTFEMTLAAIGLCVLAAIAATLWAAAHDNSLVVEAFSVPPDMAARGLSGQAIAAQLQDRLAALQAATISTRPADSYANNWGNDIKVQIPDTGVSIGELYRVLVRWLGHQTDITGEVWRGSGGIAITARAGGGGGATFTGPEHSLDALMQRAAEAIYRRTQPYRYAIYEAEQGHRATMIAVLGDLSVNGMHPRDRAWAYVGLSVTRRVAGDLSGAVADERKALAIVADFTPAAVGLDSDLYALDREEDSLLATRKAAKLLTASQADMTKDEQAIDMLGEKVSLESYLGDFAAAAADNAELGWSNTPESADEYDGEFALLFRARLHEGPTALRKAWAHLPPAANAAFAYNRDVFRFLTAYYSGDWQAVLAPGQAAKMSADFEVAQRRAGLVEYTPATFQPRQMRAETAYALAATGHLAGALMKVATTPLDCDECLRIRGRIDARAKNWAGAAYWFAMVSARSPDIPFADTDWGQMLLAKGDYDGAIAKFAAANKIGPHFADPLEMWGEALMGKKRSDLALAKFAEAAKYAPNWGRLHLKWGEALLWSGDRDGAQKQFAVAAHLDLTPSEKSELANAGAAHG